MIKNSKVRTGTKEWIYFGGCDYYRLSRHPSVLRGVQKGLKEYGLNVAASRRTTGDHELYLRLEEALARFFDVPEAVLVPNGYVANLAAVQALAGKVSHVFLDDRAHPSLEDAACVLGCPVVRFRHVQPEALARVLRRARAREPLVMTDGVFGQDGTVAPIAEYQRLLEGRGMILVDDAHAAGILGAGGRGTIEHTGTIRRGVIQTITLSKAFGTGGGAILSTEPVGVKKRSRLFAGSTPMPLPMANGALEAVRIIASDRLMRERLVENNRFVKANLVKRGIGIIDSPAPVVAIVPENLKECSRIRARLVRRGIYPSYIEYPGGPAAGFYRFAISSEHTKRELALLVSALG